MIAIAAHQQPVRSQSHLVTRAPGELTPWDFVASGTPDRVRTDGDGDDDGSTPNTLACADYLFGGCAHAVRCKPGRTPTCNELTEVLRVHEGTCVVIDMRSSRGMRSTFIVPALVKQPAPLAQVEGPLTVEATTEPWAARRWYEDMLLVYQRFGFLLTAPVVDVQYITTPDDLASLEGDHPIVGAIRRNEQVVTTADLCRTATPTRISASRTRAAEARAQEALAHWPRAGTAAEFTLSDAIATDLSVLCHIYVCDCATGHENETTEGQDDEALALLLLQGPAPLGPGVNC